MSDWRIIIVLGFFGCIAIAWIVMSIIDVYTKYKQYENDIDRRDKIIYKIFDKDDGNMTIKLNSPQNTLANNIVKEIEYKLLLVTD